MWVISRSYIPRCKSSARPVLALHRASLGCLSTASLEPRGAPPRMPTGLVTGWGPEPGPASSQCQDTHRERAAGLLGLSEGQQKGGGRMAGDRARSCTQARTEHCQAEKKLRIAMWAISGEEARHILNPHCVLGKPKYVLVSKHDWPNFIILCTSYLQQPAWCSRLVAIWIHKNVWKATFDLDIALILVPTVYTKELLNIQHKYFEYIILNY